jgi:3-oxoacyl-[acyl-carrier protein] reductase
VTEHKALSGKVSIVTGASSGIGRVIARRLSEHGCRIVLASRSDTELKTLQREISEGGGQSVAVRTDLSRYEDLDQLVHAALDEFETIDFLVNNAGWGRKAVIAKARIEDWENTFRVNLLAPMILSKLVLPTLITRQTGAVVNISSISGRAGQAGSSAYAASKSGLIAFSQSLYEEVREYGIKVTAILPGFVDTPMIPTVRHLDRSKMLRPDDVAEAVLFVLTSSATSCPVEITLRPQRTPYR